MCAGLVTTKYNLGEGTFGKVKLGRHVPTQQFVAIKVLQKDKIVEVADVQRVSREIHILKIIRHPNLIQLYEIIENKKHLFLVMEYAEGGELFEFIVSNKKLTQSQACRIFQQLIYGIEYMHNLHVVHRDLKPQNLLLDASGRLKIVDFGLSNTFKQDELVKTGCGSPCYAAPQMIEGTKYFGPKVDVWSCGVILYAMLCGCLPFQDSNTSKLYEKIVSGEYQIPGQLSLESKDLIRKMLVVDPEKRIMTQNIIQHPWFTSIRNKPVEGIIVGFNRIPSDKEVLKEMGKMGYDMDFVQKCLQANRQNDKTTTYYLLLKKMLRQGHVSSADINSPSFDKSLIEPIRKKEKAQDSKKQSQIKAKSLSRPRIASSGSAVERVVGKIEKDRSNSIDASQINNRYCKRNPLAFQTIGQQLGRRSKRKERFLVSNQQRERSVPRNEKSLMIPSIQTKKIQQKTRANQKLKIAVNLKPF